MWKTDNIYTRKHLFDTILGSGNAVNKIKHGRGRGK
jgi:hypothetical protein